MRIGTSLALIAVGAILAYAVDFDLPGIDVSTLGGILCVVGVLGLVLTIALDQMQRRPPRTPAARVPERERHVEARVPREPAYDPVVGPQGAPRDPAEERTEVAPRPRQRP